MDNLPSCLAVRQSQAGMVTVDVLPPQLENFRDPRPGTHEQANGSNNAWIFGLGAFSLCEHLPETSECFSR